MATVQVPLDRLKPRALAANSSSVQPGGGWIVRLELAWGRLRRWWLRTFRPRYVARMRERRRGECPNCTHDIIDSRDLKYYGNVCGYCFTSADDRFRWRGGLGIARMGWAEVLLFGGSLTVLAIVLGFLWPWAAIPPALLALFVIAFFRDPSRRIPQEPGAVVSPADGTITDIEQLDWADELEGPAVKIGIYLSIFNVHVNRVPETARVIEVRYLPGQLFDVRNPRARQENEQLWTLLECDDPPHRRLLVKQIAGAFARRIVCEARPGEVLRRGQKFGMIKFGSRTELYLAQEPGLVVTVEPGDKVLGGSSVLARYAGSNLSVRVHWISAARETASDETHPYPLVSEDRS